MLILLLGPPGSGKTSLGQKLAARLNYKWVDVDDHVLEPEWRCSVSEKLCQLGDRLFIEEEGRLLKEAVSTFGSGTVVSLTGSNPLDSSVMNVLQLRKDAIFIYLDVNHQDIVERLGAMKVCRIVGAHSGGLSMDKDKNGVDSEEELENATTSEHILKILQARAALYERHFDIRIWPRIGVTIEELEKEVVKSLDDYIKARHDAFTSTREIGEWKTWGLVETILEGLAPEKGLFVPKRPLPVLSHGVLHRLSRLRYHEKARIILEKLIHKSRVTPQNLEVMIRSAFNGSIFDDQRIVPIVPLGNSGIFIAELFHGPSGSFKDLSLQLLPQLLSGIMTQNERHLYLVATSGDTGSAVLSGFERLSEDAKRKIAIVVFYPTDGVSPLQKQQMVTHSGVNVSVVGIRGDFDVCQNLVKNLMDREASNQILLNELGVTFNTANSINWGRILFQIVYHIHSYLSLVHRGTIKPGDPVDVCVPTGNFGNILSAHLATKMGVPFSRIICASNSNKVLSDFFSSGLYDLRERKLVRTMSPSIDILVSSNLERLLWWCLGPDRVIQLYQDLKEKRFFQLTNEELKKVTKSANLSAGWCDEKECRMTLKRIFDDHGYCLDPHSAVAVNVAERLRTSNEIPVIVCSTAHYSKFWHDIEHILYDGSEGQRPLPRQPKRHEGIESCVTKLPVHGTVLNADLDEVFSYVRAFAADCFQPLVN